MCYLRVFVQEGASWDVAKGIKVFIWKDKWMLHKGETMEQFKPTRIPLTTVYQLLDSTTK